MGTHGGTMGSRGGYHGCPMGRIPKPTRPQGTLGPLGPLGLIGPQGLMAPQGTQGQGSWIGGEGDPTFVAHPVVVY